LLDVLYEACNKKGVCLSNESNELLIVGDDRINNLVMGFLDKAISQFYSKISIIPNKDNSVVIMVEDRIQSLKQKVHTRLNFKPSNYSEDYKMIKLSYMHTIEARSMGSSCEIDSRR
jgi:hypothetical protein